MSIWAADYNCVQNNREKYVFLERNRAVRGSTVQQTSADDDIWKGICYTPSFLFQTHLLAILFRELPWSIPTDDYDAIPGGKET